MMVQFYSSVPVSHDSVTVSKHVQYQNPETEAAKWNAAIIHFIIYTCAFPTVTCPHVEKACDTDWDYASSPALC